MADKEIDDLTDGGAVADGDVVHVFRTPNSRKATLSTTGAAIHAATGKTAPVDADTFPITDTEAANVIKKLTFANLWVWVQAKFNGTAKSTPVAADRVYIGDSAASNVAKYSTFTQIMTLVGALINGSTGKTTPVDADEIVIADSAASNATKKVSFTNLKAFLKTYFDTLYAAIGGTSPVGVHEVWIDAAAIVPGTSGAPEFVDYNASSALLKALAFDPSTAENAYFKVALPKSWNAGTLTCIPYWTNTGGSSTQTVDWVFSFSSLGNDAVLTPTLGSGTQTSSDTWLAQNDLHIGPETSAITVNETAAKGELLIGRVRRNVATDNMSGDALLLGVMLRFTTDAATDS